MKINRKDPKVVGYPEIFNALMLPEDYAMLIGINGREVRFDPGEWNRFVELARSGYNIEGLA